MHGSTVDIRVAGLAKTFVTEDGVRVPVFGGLDLAVERGEFVALLGPTGCGKTTLLRVLLGLEAPSAGEAFVAGRSVRDATAAAGVVFQQNALFPWRRVIDNVMFPMRVAGVPRRRARATAVELLSAVHLGSRAAHAYPYELSGGMQQRAALARALARDAAVLLLDEPFGSVDDYTRRALQQLLLEIWRKRGVTVLFVTHSIEEALVLGCRVAVMSARGIVEDRRISLPRPRDPLSEAFTNELISLRRAFAAALA